MAKQIILITLLSAAAVVFREQLVHALGVVIYAHNRIAQFLHLIFSDDKLGRLIQDIIALLVIPVVCGLIVSSLFWLVKRAPMPHTMAVIWVVWVGFLVIMLTQSGPAPAPRAAIQQAEQTVEPLSAEVIYH